MLNQCTFCKNYFESERKAKKFCTHECYSKNKLGSKLSAQVRLNMSLAHKALKFNAGRFKKGETPPNSVLFKKGHTPWNIGLHVKLATNGFKVGNVPWNKGKKFSTKQKPKGYGTIHGWIARHYGKATKCQNKYCQHLSAHYQWALLKGKVYEKNIDNFVMLCGSCHQRYDKNSKNFKFEI